MISLYPYQADIVAQLRAAFKRHLSVLLVSPTGSGKTVCFSFLSAKIAEAKQRIVILVHREELLQQVSETLTEFNVEHGLISAGEPYDRRHLVHVASVFTLVRRMDKVQVPDWCIADECHHAIEGSTWSKVLNEWRLKKPRLRLLGVTATPVRLSGHGLGVEADGPFEEMIIGPTVRQLIDLGALADYRIIVPPSMVDRSKLHLRAADFIRGEASDAVTKPKVVGDVLTHYAKICNGAPSVLFAPSVASAEVYADSFRGAGYVSMSIDGKMHKDVRRSIIKDFKRGAINVLTSCSLIDEGFDCKGIIAAIDVSPTESLARCMQRWGRALRIAPGKEKAIIVDHVGNAGSLENGEFIPKHGLPDDEREWSLMGVTRCRASDPSIPSPRQCGHCFAMSPAFAKVCRECGEEFALRPRKVEEVEGELQEVDPSIAKRVARIEQATAKDLDGLIKLGIQRYGAVKGPRWARYVWDGRQKKLAAKAAVREDEHEQEILL